MSQNVMTGIKIEIRRRDFRNHHLDVGSDIHEGRFYNIAFAEARQLERMAQAQASSSEAYR